MNETDVTVALAIKKTLAYRAVFNYPLSFCQLGTYLLDKSQVKYADYKRVLDTLVADNTVVVSGNKYQLNFITPIDWQSRYIHTKETLARLAPIFTLLEKIPWIKLLAVTGSAAAYNCTPEEDVDVLIVTQKNRLWLSRLFVVLILKITGSYRTDAAPQGKICPNIFLSEDSMLWTGKKHNIYIAHEIVMMQPIINREDTYLRFLKANDWVFTHFGNFPVNFPKTFQAIARPKTVVVNILENLAAWLQQWYMRSKVTTENFASDIIHFNRADNSKKILKKFKVLSSKANRIH